VDVVISADIFGQKDVSGFTVSLFFSFWHLHLCNIAFYYNAGDNLFEVACWSSLQTTYIFIFFVIFKFFPFFFQV